MTSISSSNADRFPLQFETWMLTIKLRQKREGNKVCDVTTVLGCLIETMKN